MYTAYSILLLAGLFLHSFADQTPFYADSQYNKGRYGKYVTQTFKSNPQVTSVPVINFMKPFTSSCDDGSYLFIAPCGEVANSTPMILDIAGSPIWASTKKYGEVYNLQVQHYKGAGFLTFWAGNDAVGGHGIGRYHMLDTTYTERYQIKAANGLGADLHAFTLTPNDTALVSIYDKKMMQFDGMFGRHRRGWIWDSIFQELDLESGKAIFEWRASEHINVTQSYNGIGAATSGNPWDVYHINSVDKDHLGNYLVSFRYIRAIFYNDGQTGAVLWQLGGRSNSFTDLSDGQATTTMGQHDAHFQDGHKFLTFFDNRADMNHAIDTQSHGKRAELDLSAMTARLDAAITSPTTHILSTSQGSYQTLPNGHIVLGYGFNGAIAEFTAQGDLLCEAYFQSSSTFKSGNVQSYRNLRFNWTAYPTTTPCLVLDDKVLRVSWNGATEVRKWSLVESDDEYEEWNPQTGTIEDRLLVEKTGFETRIQIHGSKVTKRFVKVAGLDGNEKALGISNVVDLGEVSIGNDGGRLLEAAAAEGAHGFPEVEGHVSHEGQRAYGGDDWVLIGLGVSGGLCLALALYLAIRHRRSDIHDSEEKEASLEKNGLNERWQRMVARLGGLARCHGGSRYTRVEDDETLDDDHVAFEQQPGGGGGGGEEKSAPASKVPSTLTSVA